jgi:hypothetical protein
MLLGDSACRRRKDESRDDQGDRRDSGERWTTPTRHRLPVFWTTPAHHKLPAVSAGRLERRA